MCYLELRTKGILKCQGDSKDGLEMVFIRAFVCTFIIMLATGSLQEPAGCDEPSFFLNDVAVTQA